MSDSAQKTPEQSQRRVSYASLGCPKALVDSEHIVTELLDQGYDVVAEEEDADVLIVNTCGFIDSAKAESYQVIERALEAQREVIVTGCLGADGEALRQRYPALRHVSGPAAVAPVVDAVNLYLPPGDAQPRLPGEARARLTPDHYAYLKISEGCNHTCSFCIIPDMRGKLVSRKIGAVLTEAEQLVADGAQELLLIAQDLSAYGLDIRYAQDTYRGRQYASKLYDLCRAVGEIAPWVRLHYVYPYPHVNEVIPLMADGLILPYLDMPLQHAAPDILKAMRRPAAAEKALQRIANWRRICPDLAIRSTFIVGFPGETDDDVGLLLDFLAAAELDRVGCFTYSAVEGAAANKLADHVDEREKLDRQERVYETQAVISARRLDRHVGSTLRVLVDEPGGSARDGEAHPAVGRTRYDAPEIDGVVHIQSDAPVRAGTFGWVKITGHDDHDLVGTWQGDPVEL